MIKDQLAHLIFNSMAILAACFWGLAANAQPLPPGALDELQKLAGNRIEAISIIGGDYAAAGGFYTFHGGDLADVSITKVGGSGAVTEPKPLGVGCLDWAPVLQ